MSFPAVTIWRVEGKQIADYRIYVDNTPLFAWSFSQTGASLSRQMFFRVREVFAWSTEVRKSKFGGKRFGRREVS